MLFVNGRRVQDSAVRAALTAAEGAAYGEWAVMIDLPPHDVDVNIHPTKEEIRFRRSQDIFKIVYRQRAGRLRAAPFDNLGRRGTAVCAFARHARAVV